MSSMYLNENFFCCAGAFAPVNASGPDFAVFISQQRSAGRQADS